MSWGGYIVIADADGDFELHIEDGWSSWVKFYNCRYPVDAYPYEEAYYRSQQDVTVPSGQTKTISMSLSFVDEHPPEWGAVRGTISGHDGQPLPQQKLYLFDSDGQGIEWWADEDGVFAAAAPPGDYRLYGSIKGSSSNLDDHFPVFFGAHPRGYSLSWEEAAIITIPTSSATVHGIDVQLIAGSAKTNPPQYSEQIGSGDGNASVTMSILPRSWHARVGAVTRASSDVTQTDIVIWAFSALKDPEPQSLTMRFEGAILDWANLGFPVWRGHNALPTCVEGQSSECIVSREIVSSIGPDDLVIEVANSLGGEYTFGDRPQFYDSVGSLFGADILWLADSGVTRGCNPPANDMFCPEDPVTRGQMAAFLDRALDLPAANGVEFGDDDGSVFEAAIERLAAAGITKGCNPPANDRFCPDAPVTRGQMAAFLRRALGAG